MKRIITLLIILALLLTVSACGGNNSSASESAPSESISAPSESESLPESQHDPKAEHGPLILTLGPDGRESYEMEDGDTIGPWVMERWEVSYHGDNPDLMTSVAYFTGEVTLRGSLSPSDTFEGMLMFTVDSEDEGKMPWYPGDTGVQDSINFALTIPDDIRAQVDLSSLKTWEDSLECVITAVEYQQFYYAFTTVIDNVTVSEIAVNS